MASPILNFLKSKAELQFILAAAVKDLDLSERAINALRRRKILLVGDLVQMDSRSLLKVGGLGKTSLAEIQSALRRLGLNVGMRVIDWNTEAGRALRDQLGKHKAPPRIGPSQKLSEDAGFIEEELREVAQSVCSTRNAEILIALFGWSGKGTRTLGSVGDQYGLTRERVRQIAAIANKKFRKRTYEVPLVQKALRTITDSLPLSRTEAGKLLLSSHFARDDFAPDGLCEAAVRLGLGTPFTSISLCGVDFYVAEGQLENLEQFVKKARRNFSSLGCVNLDALCDELGVATEFVDRFRRVVSSIPEFEWLDPNKTWFFSPEAKRNRLVNLIEKVLSVAPRISISELRHAIGRDDRLAIVPPAAVMASVIQRLGIGLIEGSTVVAEDTLQSRLAEGSNELSLIKILDKHGPVLSKDDFERLADEAGMNLTSFYLYLTFSPVVMRVARNIYAKVGAEITPGTVEELTARASKSRHPVEFGWLPSGLFWVAARLSRATISQGALAIPSFAASVVNGEWHAISSDGHTLGGLKCRDHFLWGLRAPLAKIGAEPDDTCVLAFDLAQRRVRVRVGGSDLLEDCENGTLRFSEGARENTDELA